MTTLQTKLDAVVKALREGEDIVVDVNFLKGTISYNGIEFTALEQLDAIATLKAELNQDVEEDFEEDVEEDFYFPNSYVTELENKIADLEEELHLTQNLLKGGNVGLEFPKDFDYISQPLFAEGLTDEQVQEIVDELEGINVPEGQFIAHRVGDVIVLKLRDAEGTSYVVSDGYYFAHKG